MTPGVLRSADRLLHVLFRCVNHITRLEYIVCLSALRVQAGGVVLEYLVH